MDNKEVCAPEVMEIPSQPNTKLVQALKKNALERVKAEIEMHKKIFQIELEFQDRMKQFDEKRRMIVSGDYIPTEEECKYEYADPEQPIVESEDKGIPYFWSTIFGNLDIINDMVKPNDQELIESLTDIRCILLSEPMGYRLEFEFAENKYFTNKVLTKEYYFAESFEPSNPLNFDSLCVNRCKGCKIEWKATKLDLTQKRMKHSKSNEVKTVKCDSFFNFFDPPEVKMEDADEETKDLLAADFDIAETLRLNVIPRAVIFYTGEGIEDDFTDEMGEFDEDYEDYDEDEEDSDDFDDDDDIEDADEDAGDKRKQKSKNTKAKAKGKK